MNGRHAPATTLFNESFVAFAYLYRCLVVCFVLVLCVFACKNTCSNRLQCTVRPLTASGQKAPKWLRFRVSRAVFYNPLQCAKCQPSQHPGTPRVAQGWMGLSYSRDGAASRFARCPPLAARSRSQKWPVLARFWAVLACFWAVLASRGDRRERSKMSAISAPWNPPGCNGQTSKQDVGCNAYVCPLSFGMFMPCTTCRGAAEGLIVPF